MPHMGISLKGCLLIVCPLIMQVFLSAGLLSLEQAALKAEEEERKSKEILVRITAFEKTNFDMAQSTILFCTFRKDEARIKALAKFDELDLRFSALDQALRQQRQQSENLAALRLSLREYKNRFREILTILAQGDTRSAAVLARGLRDVMFLKKNNFALINEKIVQIEQDRLAHFPQSSTDFRDSQRRLIFTGIGLNFLAGLIASFFFFRNIASRIGKIYADTRAFAAQKPMQPPLTGGDEIAKLDQSLHQMAAAMAVSQERESAVLSNAGDVIFSLSNNLTISAAGGASQSLWGMRSEDLPGKRLMALVEKKDEVQVSELLQNLGAGQNIRFFATLKLPAGHGLEFQFNASRSQDGKMIYCVARDVSAARRIERAKQQFVNMLSHDLRTPLLSQLTFLDILASGAYGEMTERGKERAMAVGRSLGSCVSLVNDFLDIEQMESGKLELKIQPCELTKLVISALDIVSELAQARAIDIKVEKLPAIELPVDDRRIVQVLQNLLSNAIKYGSSKGGSITIASHLVAEGGQDYAHIAIIDQGPGIAREIQERMFERYASTNIDNAGSHLNTSLLKNSGLGLAICKEIVQGHGGKIGVDSKEGQGCQFWFRLPLLKH